MNSKKIIANMVVKNEDRFVHFAIKSVLDYVDQIVIYDTGSTDKTVEVIKQINSDKIVFEKKGSVDRAGLVRLRIEQLKKSDSEWILLVDGDEIWKKSELEKLIKASQTVGKDIAGLVNRTRNCIGDIYHYLPENAGKYQMAGQKGNLNLRLIRKTDDLSLVGEYPLESFVNENGPIEKQDKSLLFVDCWLLHTSFLKRSSVDNSKTSGSLGKQKLWEKGISMNKSDLPEVFSEDYPKEIPSPTVERGLLYELIAVFIIPLLGLKRRIV